MQMEMEMVVVLVRGRVERASVNFDFRVQGPLCPVVQETLSSRLPSPRCALHLVPLLSGCSSPPPPPAPPASEPLLWRERIDMSLISNLPNPPLTPPVLSVGFAVGASTLCTISYVGSLYLSPAGRLAGTKDADGNTIDRDHPTVIRARIKTASLATAVTVLATGAALWLKRVVPRSVSPSPSPLVVFHSREESCTDCSIHPLWRTGLAARHAKHQPAARPATTNAIIPHLEPAPLPPVSQPLPHRTFHTHRCTAAAHIAALPRSAVRHLARPRAPLPTPLLMAP